MALVPCRECGKEVSEQAEACPYCGIKTPSKKKRQRNMIITSTTTLLVLSLLIGGSVLVYHKVVRTFSPPAEVGADNKPYNPPPSKPATSVIKQDIPVKQQIVQKDYKEKIREMLDSGQSVHEISKKTGMRIDEVRKIKKEKALDEKVK
jgi:DNA-directed RNA polymerase subunit RPC12/RpoP